MKSVLNAIHTLYLAGGDLYDELYSSATRSGLYPYQAPQNASLPYVTFGYVDEQQEYDFTDESGEHLVWINCHTETSASHAEDLKGYIKALFDNASITVSGWRHLYMLRDLCVPLMDLGADPPVWGYHFEYSVYLEKLRDSSFEAFPYIFPITLG